MSSRKRSYVWNYFVVNSDKTYCECQRCGKQLKYCRSTTNLSNHLDGHGISSVSSNALSATSQDQITLPEIVNNITESSEGGVLNTQFVNDLASMVASCGMPINIVEAEAFKMFFKKQLPRHKLPSRMTLRQTILKKFERMKINIIAQLSGLDNCAITFDSWTDPFNTQSYLGITLHFVCDGQLSSQIIAIRAFKESHTAINIAMMIEDVLNEWNIEKSSIVCCVTDNGANVKLATEKLLGPGNHVSCFAHSLNLCVKDIIAHCSDFNVIVNKVKEIVTFTKQSSKACQLLKQSQSDEIVKKKLKQSCPTRWNSTYLMLERYIDLHIHVHMTLIQCIGSPTILTPDDLSVITESLLILKPFYLATEELSADSKTTISKVIPMCNLIRKNIMVVLTATSIGKSIKEKSLEIFNKRFGNIEKSKLHSISTLLDPRFKKNDFQDIVAVTSAISRVNQFIKDLGPDDAVEQPEQSGLWSMRSIRSSDLSSGLTLDESLRVYLNSPLSPLDHCPIEIWSNLKQLNHKLAKLALKYLLIPATSVPSERVFSKAGRIITKFRASLDPKLSEELVIFASQQPKIVFDS